MGDTQHRNFITQREQEYIDLMTAYNAIKADLAKIHEAMRELDGMEASIKKDDSDSPLPVHQHPWWLTARRNLHSTIRSTLPENKEPHP